MRSPDRQRLCGEALHGGHRAASRHAFCNMRRHMRLPEAQQPLFVYFGQCMLTRNVQLPIRGRA